MSLLAALLAATLNPAASVAEAAHALRMGRPEQARTMIANAIAQGASGDPVDHLLADLALSEGRLEEALVRFEALLGKGGNDPLLLEKAGLAALRAGRNEAAAAFLDRAARTGKASWRAWNARGVVADRLGDFVTADRAYAAGLAIAPSNAVLRNNKGWSLLLRSRWQAAHRELRLAARSMPGNSKILANLDLAEAALASDLPVRRPHETNADYVARLNDAGVIGLRLGRKRLAIAAFAQAIEASERWFPRAANNLVLAGGDPGISEQDPGGTPPVPPPER